MSPDSRALIPGSGSLCPLCGESREQHVPGPPDPPGPNAACLLRNPVRRAPHMREDAAKREREFLEGLRYEDKFSEVCAGCGDADPQHWREGGWYCEGCASCPQCDSPYCEDPSHA